MKVGDKLKDNDPRVRNRVLEIIDISSFDYVTAKQGELHSVRIRKSRIYDDGKKRKSGFDLLNKQ